MTALPLLRSLSKIVSLMLVAVCAITSLGQAADEHRPNYLIIMADDCTHSDLPVYGGKNAITPNLDALAEESLVFNRAYLAEAMCQPCRSELYTGQFPMRNGCAWNHSGSRPTATSMSQHLGPLGYRVGLTGKKHVVPPASFRFENVPGVEGGCVSKTAKFDDAGMKAFMGRDPGQPFCLVVGLVVPHSPWTVGDASQFNQAELKLPPNIADTAATRSDFSKYLAEITVLDQHVGRTLDALAASGQADKTVVLFTSEQGSQFPGNKWTNWNTGVHTALVVRWPGHTKPGVRTDALVQYADVLPTLVDVAGGRPPAGSFDGSSFLPVLQGKSDRHREHAYAMHNNTPEGPPYAIRAVTDGTHHYIRNLQPDALYIEKHVMGQMQWHDYWPTWVFESTFNARTNELVKRFMRRPAEELYRIDSDPYEMTNLAGQADEAAAEEQLSAELDRWMQAQGDPGAAIDTEEQWKASKAGKHFDRDPGRRAR